MNASLSAFLFLVLIVLRLAIHVVNLIEKHLESRSTSSTNTSSQHHTQSVSEGQFCLGE
jgi:hypothetical protein